MKWKEIRRRAGALLLSVAIFVGSVPMGGYAAEEQVLEELTKAPEDGEQKMLCTIIEKRGSAPRSAGTQMVVTSLGRVVGTIGGGCAEAEVIMACRKHFYKIREGVPHPACEKIRIRMTTDNAEEEGMVCGGTILVLLEEADDLS